MFISSLEGVKHEEYSRPDCFLDTETCREVCLVSACTSMISFLKGKV